jgi:hypothetical protein
MHMLVHDSERSHKKWKCTECPQDFAKKEELLNHCNGIHQFIPNGVKGQLLKIETIKIDAPCFEPPRILSTEKVESLLSKESALDLLLSSVKLPSDLLPCSYQHCTRTFKRHFDLKRHLQWHEKKRELYAAKGLLMVASGDKSLNDGNVHDTTV